MSRVGFEGSKGKLAVASDVQKLSLLDLSDRLGPMQVQHLEDREGRENYGGVTDHRLFNPTLAGLRADEVFRLEEDRLDDPTRALAPDEGGQVGRKVVSHEVLSVAV